MHSGVIWNWCVVWLPGYHRSIAPTILIVVALRAFVKEKPMSLRAQVVVRTVINFLKPLDMESGEVYAILINNYTSQNEGFDFNMGGTATLKSLQADIDIIKPDALCREESLEVKDKIINDLGTIKSVLWTFTPDASISTSQGAGPVSVHFDRSGYKTISLIVENDAGCKAYVQDTVFVFCCGGTLRLIFWVIPLLIMVKWQNLVFNLFWKAKM